MCQKMKHAVGVSFVHTLKLIAVLLTPTATALMNTVIILPVLFLVLQEAEVKTGSL